MSTYIIPPQASTVAPALLFENVTYSVDKRKLFSLPPCVNHRKVIIENCNGVIRVCFHSIQTINFLQKNN